MADDSPAPNGAVPPPAVLWQMMTGYWVSQAIYVAAKLGVADLLVRWAVASRRVGGSDTGGCSRAASRAAGARQQRSLHRDKPRRLCADPDGGAAAEWGARLDVLARHHVCGGAVPRGATCSTACRRGRPRSNDSSAPATLHTSPNIPRPTMCSTRP